MNEQCGGKLDTAIAIFRNEHPKKFLHQLVSGQLDVDRMDYLARDSFFTGVSEGTIGYDRILKMLIVHDGELMVEEKAIYSIEEFLVSRRLMYWQVYLHKTVLSSEMMLVKIFERAKYLHQAGDSSVVLDDVLSDFLFHRLPGPLRDHLDRFCQLDDSDVISAIKRWSLHPDRILAFLCRSLLDRRLFKLRLQSVPITDDAYRSMLEQVRAHWDLDEADARYLVFTGEAVNSLYNPFDERINILFRDGQVRDISQVDNALIHQKLAEPVKKFYICFHRPEPAEE